MQPVTQEGTHGTPQTRTPPAPSGGGRPAKNIPGGRTLAAMAGSFLCYGAAHLLALSSPGEGIPPLIRTLTAFPVVLFVPGAFWVRAFSRRREMGALEFLVAGAGVSVALLVSLATLVKIAGVAVGGGHVLALAAACGAGGYAAFLHRGGTALRDDLSPRAGCLVLLAVSLAAFYAAYRPYFTWGLDRHWVVAGNPINPIAPSERIAGWRFPDPGEIADAPVTRVAGAEVVGERVYRARARAVEFTMENRAPAPRPYTLAFFLQSSRPLNISVSLNGVPLEDLALAPMVEVRCAHLVPRCCRRAWMRPAVLAPGGNTLRFLIAGAREDGGNLVLDDFSNLTRGRFLSLAREKYLFGEIGEIYDNIEVVDLGRHFFTRCFTYTDDLRAGVPGYTIAIPPLDFQLKAFLLALGGDSLQELSRAYLGWLAVLFLVLLLWAGAGERPAPSRFAVLLIPVVLAESVNLAGFRLVVGQDTPLCVWFLAAAYFLAAGRDGLFLLFAVLACLTRNHGVLFVLLTMLSYRLLYGEGARLARLLGRLSWCGLVYVAVVAVIGLRTGVLRTVWMQDFLDENYRFRLAGGNPLAALWRGAPLFTAWVAATSCLQCLLLPLRKDRLSRYLLLPMAAYYPLICMARFLKPYYLVMVVYPISVIAVRSLARLSSARPRLAAVLWAALLVSGGAAVAFLASHPLVYPEFTAGLPGVREFMGGAR